MERQGMVQCFDGGWVGVGRTIEGRTIAERTIAERTIAERTIKYSIYVHPANSKLERIRIELELDSLNIGEIRSKLIERFKDDQFLLIYQNCIVADSVNILNNAPVYVYIPHFSLDKTDQRTVCICMKKSLPITDDEESLRYVILSNTAMVMDLLIFTADYRNKSYYLGKSALSDSILTDFVLFKRLSEFSANTIFMPMTSARGIELETMKSNNVKVPIFVEVIPLIRNRMTKLTETMVVICKLSDSVKIFIQNIRNKICKYLTNIGINFSKNKLSFYLVHGNTKITDFNKQICKFQSLTNFKIYISINNSAPFPVISSPHTPPLVSPPPSSSPSTPPLVFPPSSPSAVQSLSSSSLPSPSTPSAVQSLSSSSHPPSPSTPPTPPTPPISPLTLAKSPPVKTRNEDGYLRSIQIRGTPSLDKLSGVTRNINIYSTYTVENLLDLYRGRIRWECNSIPRYLTLVDDRGNPLPCNTPISEIPLLVDVIGSDM